MQSKTHLLDIDWDASPSKWRMKVNTPLRIHGTGMFTYIYHKKISKM